MFLTPVVRSLALAIIQETKGVHGRRTLRCLQLPKWLLLICFSTSPCAQHFALQCTQRKMLFSPVVESDVTRDRMKRANDLYGWLRAFGDAVGKSSRKKIP